MPWSTTPHPAPMTDLATRIDMMMNNIYAAQEQRWADEEEQRQEEYRSERRARQEAARAEGE